ncbi:MAG: PD-(D/E)XK nuclease family protein [Kiritimatiellia bacterium]
MAHERHFLGWDEPVTEKVCKFLLPQPVAGPVRLDDHLMVVPTRQAGRRLKEALARHCGISGGALLSLRIVEPSFFLVDPGPDRTVANPALVKTVWADVLLGIRPKDYPACFPAKISEKDFPWALDIGELIQSLREKLTDGGYTIGDVVRLYGAELEEAERWLEMARLEEKYLTRLQELGAQDPCCAEIERANRPTLDGEKIRRIVVAAVADPAPLALRALEALSQSLEVVVLVHAPSELADHFDEWGRPIPAKWKTRIIDLPHQERTIRLAGGPADQSRIVLEEIAAASEYGPADLAIGVPDRSILPFLECDLAAQNLLAFDPADRPLTQHPLYGLIESFCRLVLHEGYDSLRLFLRHPDVLAHLIEEYGLKVSQLLDELDRWQNRVIPLRLADLEAARARLATEPLTWKALGPALEFVRKHIEQLEIFGFETGLRELLRTVYSHRKLSRQRPEDDEFVQAAGKVSDLLTEIASPLLTKLYLGTQEKTELFLRRLKEQTYHRERSENAIDLEGWLELLWDGAPFLIITGMNEGRVPDGQLEDVFLPDSLRRKLGLRDEEQRFARDAFFLQSIIEARKSGGRLRLVVGKTGPQGEPLKPSRLLFRCHDTELVERARMLFAVPPVLRQNPPFTYSFRLKTDPPPDIPEDFSMKSVAITQFRDYLACPFRFYLRHVLGMEEIADLKVAPDTLDFGNFIHVVLRDMALEKSLRTCSDEKTLKSFLECRLEQEMRRIYGESWSVPIEIFFEAARQRLYSAASVQAACVKDGWTIVDFEQALECELDSVRISGRIDRVDLHRKTGAVRIIDYKTGDKRQLPQDVHLGSIKGTPTDYATVTVGKAQKRWIDLQLPLYRLLLSQCRPVSGEVQLAFFNLPKATEETEISVWEDFTPLLQVSAEQCALEVVRRIRQRVFWPPAEKVGKDKFERILGEDVIGAVDGAGLEQWTAKAKA